MFALWCVVAGPTLKGFLRGTLFPAPCLASLPPEYVERVHPAGRKGREEARPRAGQVEGAPTPRSRSPGLSRMEKEEGEGRRKGRAEAELEGREPVAEEGAGVGAGAEAFLTGAEGAGEEEGTEDEAGRNVVSA